MSRHQGATLCIIYLFMIVVAQSDDKYDFLNAHNVARATLGIGGMQWNDNLANYASSYAQQQRENCKNGILKHSGGPYGENLFWGMGADYSPKMAVNNWVDEERYYHYDSNSCDGDKACGHYTQVMWANSLYLGCDKFTCNNAPKTIYIICSYDPPGNVVGQLPYSLPNRLKSNHALYHGQEIRSQNGVYNLIMQSDCNFVLYHSRKAIWASNTYLAGSNCWIIMETDGNLVLYDGNKRALWSSNTKGSGNNCYLMMQNDGNAVVYKPNNKPIWASNTNGKMFLATTSNATISTE